MAALLPKLIFHTTLVTAIYFLLGNLGLLFASINHSTSPIWLASGFAIAILILDKDKFWPAIFLGAFLVNFMSTIPLLAAFFIASGNTLEAYLGAIVYFEIRKKFMEGSIFVECCSLIGTALIPPIISASIGASTLLIFDHISKDIFGITWTTWWSGDAIGIIILLPIMTIAFESFRRESKKEIFFEINKIFIKLVPITILAFITAYLICFIKSGNPFIFLVFPFLLASFFFSGVVGLYLSLMIFTSVSVYSTLIGIGTFAWSDTNTNLLTLQIYLASLAITARAIYSFSKLLPIQNFSIMLGVGWLFSGAIFYYAYDLHLLRDQRKFERIVQYKQELIQAKKELIEINWEGSSKREGDMLKEMLDNISPIYNNEINFWILDAEKINEKNILYTNSQEKINPKEWEYIIAKKTDLFFYLDNIKSIVHKLKIAEREYLTLTRNQKYLIGNYDFTVPLLALLGALLSLAVTAIFINIKASYLKVESLVEDRNKDLAQEKLRWGALMESAPVGIYQTNTQGKNVYVSPFLATIVGITNEELLADDWMSVIHPDDAEEVIAKWNDSVAHDCYFEMEFRILRQDKVVVWVNSSAVPYLGNNNEKLGYIGVVFDVSEKKSKEEEVELKRAVALEAARLASIGEMSASIAHEINNPLTIISGAAAQLRRIPLTGEASEKVLKIEEKINATIKRIVKIIHGLRNISRDAEDDKMELIELQKIFDDILEISTQKFRAEGIKFEFSIDSNDKILAKPVQLGQVILNLFNNSVDAIRGSESPWIRIISEKQGGKLQLKVMDSGKGIPKEIADKMMQPFFTTKGAGKGTGLGLSISKRILEEHGGKLSLDQSCANTCFIIELPLANSVELKTAA